MKHYRLFYKEEPPLSMDKNHHELTDDDLVWQMRSLPLGNGYFGASVYGYLDVDRIQITENSFSNPYYSPRPLVNRFRCGVTSFANLYIKYGHDNATNYVRELSLNDAIFQTTYQIGDSVITREIFTSHPDKVLAMRITSDKDPIDLSIFAEVPYIGDFCQVEGDGFARSGEVRLEGEQLVIESKLDYYQVVGQGRIAIRCNDGKVEYTANGIEVKGTRLCELYFFVATNYKLESRVFMEPDPKKKLAPYEHPERRVKATLNEALSFSYEELKKNHIEDHARLFNKASVSIGDTKKDEARPTDELIAEAKASAPCNYLMELLFQYGRYMLIASSRGYLPSNLQGIWSNYRTAPWSSGYWHNINVQMNYWGCWQTGLGECFIPYSNYLEAYLPLAKEHADAYLKRYYPDRIGKEGENGWTIGTGGWPYTISGPGGHSGPGTGAFTSLMFFDHYDYTRDEEFLRKIAYPVLRDMSLFFSKTLVFEQGAYLVEHSASPEQMHEGKYFAALGCAFDQQMIYENYKRTLECAEILGIEEPLLDVIREQIDKLDPVIIGESGQIKEFREERFYGDIGEYHHRHISHLVGLYPGTLITKENERFASAARYSLDERGDTATGWATCHRMLCRARLGDGQKCYDIAKKFISNYIPENLWDQHPPFQIDGNFGYMTVIAEMIMQSHTGCITLLPAIPAEWSDGSFEGLVARGGFVVGCEFNQGKPTKINIESPKGGKLVVRDNSLNGARANINGKVEILNSNELCVNTKVGDVITIDI